MVNNSQCDTDFYKEFVVSKCASSLVLESEIIYCLRYSRTTVVLLCL